GRCAARRADLRPVDRRGRGGAARAHPPGRGADRQPAGASDRVGDSAHHQGSPTGRPAVPADPVRPVGAAGVPETTHARVMMETMKTLTLQQPRPGVGKAHPQTGELASLAGGSPSALGWPHAPGPRGAGGLAGAGMTVSPVGWPVAVSRETTDEVA